MKPLISAAIVLLSCTLVRASYIGDIAAGMQARAWVKLPPNASLQALDLPRAIFAWNNSAVWDPVRKQVRQIGAGGTCCSDGRYWLTTYEDATDTWSMRVTGFSGSGHAYDGNAINPATGFQYFGRYHDSNVRTWNGSTFGTLPALPIPAATTPATAWFPEINNGQGGLCYFGTSGQRCFWDGTKWTTLSTLSGCGTYNNFAEYHPVHRVIWAGAGNGGDRVSYRINAGLAATRLKDAPVSLNNHQSVQSCDPAGDKYIIFCQTDNSLWEFDIMSDTWARINDAAGPRPDATSTPYMFNVPISDYSVILYLWHYYDRREVYLYKHTQSSAVDRRPAGPGPGLVIAPNPFKGAATITLNGLQTAGSDRARLAIHDVCGKAVHRFEGPVSVLQRGYAWDAGGSPVGIYILKVQTGKRTFVRELCIQK